LRPGTHRSDADASIRDPLCTAKLEPRAVRVHVRSENHGVTPRTTGKLSQPPMLVPSVTVTTMSSSAASVALPPAWRQWVLSTRAMRLEKCAHLAVERVRTLEVRRMAGGLHAHQARARDMPVHLLGQLWPDQSVFIAGEEQRRDPGGGVAFD